MYNDIRVPKEKFLVEYFESKKSVHSSPSVPFDSILKSVQNKSNGNDLESLMEMPKKDALGKIEKFSTNEIIPLLNESVIKLKEISKE